MIRNVLETLTLWSGWRDSNSRHPAPKAGALPDCATPRKISKEKSSCFQTRDEKARSMLAASFWCSLLKWLKDLNMGKSKLSGCWLPQEFAEKRIQDRLRDWPQRNVARFHFRFV